jgi:uncharacterized protein YeeX (DUF496 family)
MTEAEIVARLLTARQGVDAEANINKVIDYLCDEYHNRVANTLMEEAEVWMAKTELRQKRLKLAAVKAAQGA